MSEDLLRLEYAQATDLARALIDVRFKLLAFAPTIAGTAVALLGRNASTTELLAVGAVGLAASCGIVVYELHNTVLYEFALERAAAIEQKLGLALYSGRPRYVHDRPLAVVYAVVLGAWTYLVAWGALRAGDVAHAQVIGGLIGAAVAVLSGAELARARWKEGPAHARPSSVTSPES